MALTELLHTLQEEADAELAVLRRDAQIEAATIVASAEGEAERLRAEMLESSEADARAQARERLAAARLEAAGRLRSAREQAYATLRVALDGELAGLRETSTYAAILAALIDEALAALPAATRVAVDARDAELAARLLTGRSGGLRIDGTLDTWGGVEVATADGRRIENTLEARLAGREPELRRTVAAAIA